MRLFIYFLGKRGGGSLFTSEVLESLLEKEIDVTILVHESNLELRDQIRKMNRKRDEESQIFTHLFRIRFSFVVDFWRFLKYDKKCDSSLIALNTMMSHRDYWIQPILKILKIRRWQVIHDDKRHKGDYYPGNYEIIRRARKSERVWVLSKSVRNKLEQQNIASNLIFKYELTASQQVSLDCNYILSIGRQRNYQGRERIDKLLQHPLKENCYWVIAGESTPRMTTTNEAIFLPRWLEDFQFFQLIARARVVVFPYLEATQSGVLKIAQELGKVVVVTPVSGLTEFVHEYADGFICSENTVESFIDSLESALTYTSNSLRGNQILRTSLSEDFITSIQK